MAQADFIPAGRTSRVVRGDVEIQIQTEYAWRPNPRLTTSLFTKGQIINKIERELPKQVKSFEDKIRDEDMLSKQHHDVLKILKDKGSALQFLNLPPENSDAPVTPRVTVTRAAAEDPNITVVNRLAGIKGVEKVFRLDNSGTFLNSAISSEFKKKYANVFRELFDIINVFAELPGGQREKGVYEIQRNRLYFASSGRECYFILVQPKDFGVNFEKAIKIAVSD